MQQDWLSGELFEQVHVKALVAAGSATPSPFKGSL
jgi:hypothetical protein